MAVEYDISSDVAVIKETGSVSQCARVTQMYSGQITYDDEAGSKFATATINGKSQRVMLCIAVSGTVTYDDVPSLYSTVDGHRCLNIVTPTETGTPDDVPSLYETVVIDGQNVRAVRCIMINKTPVYDGVSSTCTFTGDDGKTHTAQLVNKVTGGSVQVIIKGTSPLNLPDAIANSLSYVKAFGGTEQGGVPSGYTPLEYIEMTGTQYLDTGITGYANTNVLKIKINASQISNTCFITFQNPNSGASQLGLFLSSSWWTFQYGSPSRLSSLASANTDVSIEATNGSIKINGVSVTGTLASEFSISEQILIGTSINGTTVDSRRFQGKIYYFRWEDSNGNVLFDGVPAKDSNNVAGMYDTVSGRFLTNQGSGSITAGPAIVPTPSAPMNIISNNGALRIQGSATGTVIQTGDPTPTEPIYPVFYQKGDLVLRAIDTDADTYDASTQTITRAIGYHIFDGTESFGVSTAYGRSLYIAGVATTWGVNRSKDALCQYFLGTSSPSSSMPEFTCFFNASGHFYFRTAETVADFKAWLAELYANGTPLIVWFVKNTSATESFTPSVYADGTMEIIEDTIGNTATAEMLLKVGDYQDEQEILSGAVTRNVGVLVLDGTESWNLGSSSERPFYLNNSIDGSYALPNTPFCTHFQGVASTVASLDMPDLTTRCGYVGFEKSLYIKYKGLYSSGVAAFKQFLADQYAAGTPVIIVYPLATPTTESVAGQTLQVTDGDNVLEITQASLNGLELEARYNAAVSLTVQEVQDANLDNNVTVTIQ